MACRVPTGDPVIDAGDPGRAKPTGTPQPGGNQPPPLGVPVLRGSSVPKETCGDPTAGPGSWGKRGAGDLPPAEVPVPRGQGWMTPGAQGAPLPGDGTGGMEGMEAGRRGGPGACPHPPAGMAAPPPPALTHRRPAAAAPGPGATAAWRRPLPCRAASSRGAGPPRRPPGSAPRRRARPGAASSRRYGGGETGRGRPEPPPTPRGLRGAVEAARSRCSVPAEPPPPAPRLSPSRLQGPGPPRLRVAAVGGESRGGRGCPAGAEGMGFLSGNPMGTVPDRGPFEPRGGKGRRVISCFTPCFTSEPQSHALCVYPLRSMRKDFSPTATSFL